MLCVGLNMGTSIQRCTLNAKCRVLSSNLATIWSPNTDLEEIEYDLLDWSPASAALNLANRISIKQGRSMLLLRTLLGSYVQFMQQLSAFTFPADVADHQLHMRFDDLDCAPSRVWESDHVWQPIQLLGRVSRLLPMDIQPQAPQLP